MPSVRRKGLDLTLPPRRPGQPATRWLLDALRTAIVAGAVPPGTPIPSSRELARVYSLARGTVVSAIDGLCAEGYLRSVRGSGVYVRSSLPDAFLETPPPSTAISEKVGAHPPLSAFAKRLQAYSHHTSLRTQGFRTNLPALENFPSEVWARTMSSCVRRLTASELVASDPGGYAGLRTAVAEYLTTSRGANCRAENVIIVSGVREAIDLTARLLLSPGDRVLVEDPGYQVSYTSFQAAGAKLVSMPIDPEGAAPRTAQMRGVRLLYVTPGHQFPTGVTMSAARRFEILARADKAGAYVFEDDYDSEYRYQGRPLPVLQGLDRYGKVILAGSFNKTMFPALRLGYMVLPQVLVEPFHRLKALSHVQSIAEQIAFCQFLRQGDFARHLRQMRKLYAERYRSLFICANLHLSDYLTLSPIQAGLQTVGWLREGLIGEDVAAAAAKQRLDVVPVSRYSLNLKIPEGIQMGFAALNPSIIEDAVKTLARALRAMTRGVALQPAPLIRSVLHS